MSGGGVFYYLTLPFLLNGALLALERRFHPKRDARQGLASTFTQRFFGMPTRPVAPTTSLANGVAQAVNGKSETIAATTNGWSPTGPLPVPPERQVDRTPFVVATDVWKSYGTAKCCAA